MVHRAEIADGGKSLEDIFFEITEGKDENKPAAEYAASNIFTDMNRKNKTDNTAPAEHFAEAGQRPNPDNQAQEDTRR